MKILFLQNFWHEHIGTMCLASVLKARGDSVAVGIGAHFSDLEGRIKSYSPDLICFSCTTGEHLWALDMASKVKKITSVPIIFGGPQPTYMPEMIENGAIDYICVGEGEGAMADLAARLEKGLDASDIPNVVTKNKRFDKGRVRALIDDLDKMPLPDRSIYYDEFKFIRDNPVKHFMAGRGCMFDCSYCYNHLWKELYKDKGRILRYHSPDYCIRELVDVKSRYPLKTVVFEDDTFTANKQWLKEFLAKYKEKVGIPFACNVHASTVTDETARILAEAGCFRVNMGVESGSEKLRQIVLNKKILDADIVKAAAFLKKYNIKLLTNNMLGIPGESLEDAFRTVELNIKIKSDYPWCSILQPYPNTKIAEYAMSCRNAGKTSDKKFYNTFFEGSVLEQPNIKEVVNLQKLFYLAVKAPLLFPLIKRMIRLRLDRFYNLLFLMTFAYRYMRCQRMGFFQMIVFSLRNSRLYGKPQMKKA